MIDYQGVVHIFFFNMRNLSPHGHFCCYFALSRYKWHVISSVKHVICKVCLTNKQYKNQDIHHPKLSLCYLKILLTCPIFTVDKLHFPVFGINSIMKEVLYFGWFLFFFHCVTHFSARSTWAQARQWFGTNMIWHGILWEAQGGLISLKQNNCFEIYSCSSISQ